MWLFEDLSPSAMLSAAAKVFIAIFWFPTLFVPTYPTALLVVLHLKGQC